MPKTASKRAEARKIARVQRAHQMPQPAPATRATVRPGARSATAVNRRAQLAARRNKPRGLAGIIRDYPWATTIFTALLVGLAVLTAYTQQLGPWAPPAAPKQATCNLATHICTKAPLMTIDTKKLYTATIKTAKGDIVVTLDAKGAPIATNNFVFLAQQNYYNGLYFWRVEKNGQPSPITKQPSNLDLIQGGSVSADGQDKNNPPGYTIKDDAVTGSYTTGTVAMAKTSAPNSGGAQFFIDTGDNSKALTSKVYAIFGTVTSGLDVAQKITPDDKILSVSISVSTPPTPAPTSAATAAPTSATTPATTATATKK